MTVRGIPTLVLLDVDHDGPDDEPLWPWSGTGAEFPWARPVRDLEEDAGALSDHRALVVLCDGCTSEAQERCRAQLEPLAVELNARAKAAQAPECLVVLATHSAGAQRIRQLCRLDASAEPQVVVLDIPDQGGFYLPETEVTTEGLRAMLGDVKAGTLARKQLGGS